MATFQPMTLGNMRANGVRPIVARWSVLNIELLR